MSERKNFHRGGRYRSYEHDSDNSLDRSGGSQDRKGSFNRDKGRGDQRRGRRGNPKLKGLSGREIGMYYKKRAQERNNKPLSIICLSDSKKNQIQSILQSNPIEDLKKIEDDEKTGVYWFKTEFIRNITGSLYERIEKAASDLIQIPRIDEAVYNHFKEKENNSSYLRMIKQREKLPAFAKRNEILKLIEENQVVVISGETGCGKTTQVAQFILDHYIQERKGSLCKVICTQPRRISAISVAERVAEERAERLGLSVGYQIRLEKKPPREKASICFCTTGVVLKKMESDPSMKDVSHIILDEIHERNVPSDFLITLLKKIVRHRKDLKVILMSATLNSQAFSDYYDNAPHINIPGFTYPVKEYYLEDVLQMTNFEFREEREVNDQRKRWGKYKVLANKNQEFYDVIGPYLRQLEHDEKYSSQVIKQLYNPNSEKLNMDLVFELLRYICKHEEDDGAILIFVPGYTDISSLHKSIEQSSDFPKNKYLVFPLHSLMPTIDQKQIFNPAPTGMRKIIIATNIAETSITIDDVIFVIDTGRIKMTDFNSEKNQETLNVEWVSLANASQRRGRAGRVRSGVCYHLYSKVREMHLEAYQKPEILRERLEAIILQAKMLQLGKIESFFKELMDSPDPQSVEISVNLLKRLNALDDNENLTPLGYHLAKLPMAPQLGKMVLFGAIFSCLDPILSIAVSLDYKEPFQIPLGKEKIADKKKKELSRHSKSDHFVYHEALCRFEESTNPGSFCWEWFLSMPTLKLLQNLKRDFMQHLYEMGFVSDLNPKSQVNNINSENRSLVKAIICAGLYPNVAIVRQTKYGSKVWSVDREKMDFHPKSVLSGERSFDSPMVAYYRRIKSTSYFIHDATIVQALPVVFFGDHFECYLDNGHHNIGINGRNLRFKCSGSTAEIIRRLRVRLNWILENKVSNPASVDWREDTAEIQILRAIRELITIEDVGEIDLSDFDDIDVD